MSSLGLRVNQRGEKQQRCWPSSPWCQVAPQPPPRALHPLPTHPAPHWHFPQTKTQHVSGRALPTAPAHPHRPQLHPFPLPTCTWAPSSLFSLPSHDPPVAAPSLTPLPLGAGAPQPQKSSAFCPPPQPRWVLEGLGRPRGHHCPRGRPSATQGDVYSSRPRPLNQTIFVSGGASGGCGRCTSPLSARGNRHAFNSNLWEKELGLE